MQEDSIAETLSYLAKMSDLIRTTARSLRDVITVDQLEMTIEVASEDAADTATRYGYICAAVYPALSAIESVVKVKKRNVRIAPNFILDEGKVIFQVKLHGLTFQLLWIAIRFFIGYIAHTNKEIYEVL